MLDELDTIEAAIENRRLPLAFDDLLGPLWDPSKNRFHVQETFILDYKETLPTEFAKGYGAGIIRLAMAFYNAYGGIILFGVRDRELTVTGVGSHFDIEFFNRAITDFTGEAIECISKSYQAPIQGTQKQICALLVPKRGAAKPLTLARPLDKYQAGTLWIRDRHEVVQAAPHHMPLLFSRRSSSPTSKGAQSPLIHRSFPPSPSTQATFVNRGDLLASLWKWLAFGDQPRLYLHGPGGSGKSTLAFEFARQLAHSNEAVLAEGNDKLDYVVYISAKDTELNPFSGQQQPFQLRQFENKDQQVRQILVNCGLVDASVLEGVSFAGMDGHLTELFDNFSGLLVIDDIDALSRRGLDTGEEYLFLKAALAKRKTRILYTLRTAPSYALNSAIKVPGLDEKTEFFDFLQVCCQHFEVVQPPAELTPRIMEETSRLPLLIETLVGLRRHFSNYVEAVNDFSGRGGDDARRYLYQREYDRLSQNGRARQILAGLYYVGEPVSSSVFTGIFQISNEHFREALSESGSIFVSTSEGEKGETLYQLAAPALPFVGLVSEQLPHVGSLQRRVDHFRSEGLKVGGDEATAIVVLQNLVRERRFMDAVDYSTELAASDTILVNPKVQSLLGQAYSELGPEYRERARQCFKHAEGLNYRDIYMMRRWFNLELFSGYGVKEAERICHAMISDSKLSDRARSEFWSKLGSCEHAGFEASVGAKRDKALVHLRKSIICYLEGMWIGRNANGFDPTQHLTWMEKPLRRFIARLEPDVEQFFVLLEEIVAGKHDVDLSAAQMLVRYFELSSAFETEDLRPKIRGQATRVGALLGRELKSSAEKPGFRFLHEALNNIKK